MGIDYDNDLLKHFVRTNGWLPACRRRFARVKAERPARRLRYFTFCAVKAVDVLMLDVAKVIKRSSGKKFDTVVFFDKTPEAVIETEKRIPGAIGFPGNFTEVVLSENVLAPDGPDTEEIRKAQRVVAQRQEFIENFPFDVVNLDLEEFLLKPGDERPGKVINALRKVLEWQKRPLLRSDGAVRPLDEFSLMFTTQIGPPDIANDQLQMLQWYLEENVERDQTLLDDLEERAGTRDIAAIRENQFSLFFKLAMPKLLLATVSEADWYIDPDNGISIYEFARPWKDGTYQMLHLIFDVRRKVPPQQQRAPQVDTPEAAAAYSALAKEIFQNPETLVVEAQLDGVDLAASLEQIRLRRRQYCPED